MIGVATAAKYVKHATGGIVSKPGHKQSMDFKEGFFKHLQPRKRQVKTLHIHETLR